MYLTEARKTAAERLLILAAAIIAVLSLAAAQAGSPAKGIKAATEAQRMDFIRSLGWEPVEDSEAEKKIVLPEKLPGVLESYNRIQREAGYDLEKYCGKEISVYTYDLTERCEDQRIQCTLFLFRNRIIGGDIHSTAFEGFMKPLAQKENG